jgi:uracil-DNA glycosylase family 4
MSFFPEGVAGTRPDTELVSKVPRCDLCRYYKTCTTPKQKATGKGNVLIVGEFPDTHSDLLGRAISGAGASLLSAVLAKGGLSFKDVVFVNALACRPDTKNGEKNLHAAVKYCRPLVREVIDRHKPSVIIPMGDLAVASVLAPFRPAGDSMNAGRWSGYQIPLAPLGAWVCPTVNPGYAASAASGDGLVKRSRVPEVLFTRHVTAALRMLDEDVVDTDPSAGLVINPPEEQTVAWLNDITESGGIVAFDFETTGLKPHRQGQRIVCCSVCYEGDVTYSFMWTPAVAKAMVRMLQSKRVGKIASNLTFETCWCMEKLKTRVANWRWDTMQTAHVIDARGDDPEDGITSIKFQAFALFGVRPWDKVVKPYLSSGKGGANGINRVTDVDRRALLTYCAIDSRMEYLVARRQAEILGLSLEDWK